MTTQALAKAELLETVLVEGSLKDLSATDRLAYYQRVCQSLGLNPLTKPFLYITLNGKLTLYAARDCTDQLRKLHHISVELTSREYHSGLCIIGAKATDGQGRSDESNGAVTIEGLKGDPLANAIMKCETKAKRRVTLSICGLGWLDETEIETIPDSMVVDVDTSTGEIKQPTPAALPKPRSAAPQRTENGTPAPGPTPAQGRGQTPARLPNPGPCPTHNVRMGRNPEGRWCHKLSDGSFCYADVPENPTPDVAEKAESQAPEPPQFEDTPLGHLQRDVFGTEMEWADFESKVLHMPWSQWVRLGGTINTAQAQWTKYLGTEEAQR